MTVLYGVIERNNGVPTPPVVAPPPSGDFLALVQSMAPIGLWRLNDTSTTAFSDLTGSAPGAWVTGAPGIQRPTLVDGDGDGFSSDLFPNVLGSIPHFVSHETPSGGVFIVVQTRDAVTKQAIVNRHDGAGGGGGDGRWLIEHTANGQITGKLVPVGLSSVSVASAPGVLVKGMPMGIALTWGAAGLKLYCNTGTPAASLPGTITGASGVRSIAVGAWYTGADWFSGLIGWLVYFSTQPTNAAVGLLMDEVKTAGILRANDDVLIGEAGASTTGVDVLANDHYPGAKASASLNITAQGTLGNYAVQGDKNLSYTAGSTGGTDAAGRYTVNGSAPAILTATVTPAPQGTWSPTTIRALPAGYTWQVFYGHDTGGLTQSFIDSMRDTYSYHGVFPYRRYAISSIGGLPTARDRIADGDQVESLDWDAPFQFFKLSDWRYLLLRFHIYPTAYWGCDGKYHLFNIGRGWTGPNPYKPANTGYGTHGAGCNAMHAKVLANSDPPNPAQTNYLQGLASWCGSASDYGNAPAGSNANNKLTPNTWHTIDIIADLGTPPAGADGGWRLLIDDLTGGQNSGVRLAQTMNGGVRSCGDIDTMIGCGWKMRSMSGGNPDQLIGMNFAGDHHYAGYFLARSH